MLVAPGRRLRGKLDVYAARVTSLAFRMNPNSIYVSAPISMLLRNFHYLQGRYLRRKVKLVASRYQKIRAEEEGGGPRAHCARPYLIIPIHR